MQHLMSRSCRALLGVGLLWSIFGSLLFAQTDTAVLFGLVNDAPGGVIAGSKVRLLSRGTGAFRDVVTDARGLYLFEVLPPGEYELTVESPGFKQFRDSQVTLQVAQISRLNVLMEIGTANEFVEVQGTASPLNSETVSQGTVIGETKIVQLPLNGRQFIQLALLVPGANA